METTCGIVLMNNNYEILIGHPTHASYNVWSIPKGLCDKNETYLECAMREFHEETSLNLKNEKKDIEYIGEYFYPNKKKKLIGYFLKTDEYFLTSILTCNSLVYLKDGSYSFPEIDAFTWLQLKDVNMLHPTQKQLVKDILLKNKM